MDIYNTCQKCGATLSEKPEMGRNIECSECSYINEFVFDKSKTLVQQLNALTIEMTIAEVEQVVSTIMTKLGKDVLISQNIEATVKIPSNRVSSYLASTKSKDIKLHNEDKKNTDFTLFEKIGEGGMGVIYLAEQSSLNRKVALKMTKSGVMTDAMMENFLIEALVTSEFDHPNVVPIHDAGVDAEGRLFYIMKRVQGITWDSLLHPKTKDERLIAGAYSLSDHINILNSVCNAVAFAHSKDVIHRDLKPANVMIGKFGEVIVLDWGLAVSTVESDKLVSIEELNTFGGTIIYMAPEMAKVQKSQIGKHSDIYLLGAILYEIITGHAPHTGNNFKEVLINALQNKIRPPDEGKDIDMVLMETALKAMSLKPLKRFLSVTNFQRALKRYTKGKTSHIKSVRIAEKAMGFLQQGEKTGNFKSILRSQILFKMALRLWTGSREAELGKQRGEHLILKSAYESGEIDLLFSFMREKSLHIDFKLQAEKDKYILYRQNHPFLSAIFSKNVVYQFLNKLDSTLIAILKKLNNLLKLVFLALLIVLPLFLYNIGAPSSYVISFSVVSISAVVLGEIFWRKSIHKEKG
ncbi:MAG: serine/threonine protein kinase [Candidatus Aureabacteria bacterium]|nr:serine/threonine protein kinase [Candidatus Auribacterota bacterium]